MSPGYRLTPEAQANVDEICAFIAQDSVDAALRVLDALEDAFHQLASTPGIGHRREDLTTRPVRFWKVYSYLIMYDPATAPLGIIAVLHGARDVEQLLKNGKITDRRSGHVRRKPRSSRTGRSRVNPWVFRSHMATRRF